MSAAAAGGVSESKSGDDFNMRIERASPFSAAAAGGAGAAAAAAPAEPYATTLNNFYIGRYNAIGNIRQLERMLAIADTIHDMYRGYRNKPGREGLVEAREFIDGFLESGSHGLTGEQRKYLQTKAYNIEEAIKEYFETKTGIEWVSAIDPNARMTYETILESAKNVEEAQALAIELRDQFDSFEIKPGNTPAKELLKRGDNRKIIAAFMITFLFGSKDVPCFFTCDSPAKRVGTILSDSENAHGLMLPQNIADSAPTSFKKLTAVENVYRFPTDIGSPYFTVESNDFTKDKVHITYSPMGAKQFTDKSRFAWTYDIKTIAGGLITQISYGTRGGEYPSEGPSVDQLLELQHKVRNGIQPYTVSIPKITQLAISEYINSSPGFIKYIKTGIDSNTYSYFFDEKRGGDHNQVKGARLCRYLLQYVALVTADPTCGIKSRLEGTPTVVHNNDKISLYKTVLTERALNPEEIAANERTRKLREINRYTRVLYFLCRELTVKLPGIIARLTAANAAKAASPFWVTKLNDIIAYLSKLLTVGVPAFCSTNAALNRVLDAFQGVLVAAASKDSVKNRLKHIRDNNVYATESDANIDALKPVIDEILAGVLAHLNTPPPIGGGAAAAAAAPNNTMPYTLDFLQDLISMLDDPREFDPTARIYSEIHLNPRSLKAISDQYTTIINATNRIRVAGAGERIPIVDIYSQINQYNSILRAYCESFFDQTNAEAIYQHNCIIWKSAPGAAVDRTTIAYGIAFEGEGDEEDNAGADDAITAVPTDIVSAVDTAYKASIKNKRNVVLYENYRVATQTLLSYADISVIPVPAVEGGAAAGGAGRGGAYQHGGGYDIDIEDADAFEQMFENFLEDVATIVNETLSTAYPALTTYARRVQLEKMMRRAAYQPSVIPFIEAEKAELGLHGISVDELEASNNSTLAAIWGELNTGLFGLTNLYNILYTTLSKPENNILNLYIKHLTDLYGGDDIDENIRFNRYITVNNFMIRNTPVNKAAIGALTRSKKSRSVALARSSKRNMVLRSTAPPPGYLRYITPNKALSLAMVYDLVTMNRDKVSYFSLFIGNAKLTISKVVANIDNLLYLMGMYPDKFIKLLVSTPELFMLYKGGARRQTRHRHTIRHQRRPKQTTRRRGRKD